MGTTIHAHIEVKRGMRWVHYGAPNVDRNYLLFAAINHERIEDFRPSIREQIIPQASIKDLPNDMSEVTEFCYLQDKSGMKLHGEGVLTAEDIRNLQNHLYELTNTELNYINKYDLEESIFRTYINGNSIASHQGWDDVRIIFWYDN